MAKHLLFAPSLSSCICPACVACWVDRLLQIIERFSVSTFDTGCRLLTVMRFDVQCCRTRKAFLAFRNQRGVLPHARPSTLEVLTAEGCSTSMARTWHSFLQCFGAASKPAFPQQLRGNNSRPEASALPQQATLACQSMRGSGS